MEAVSEIYRIPDQNWVWEIEQFWWAFWDVFGGQDTRNDTVGSHVHMSPLKTGYYLDELKSVAYTTIIYEKHVLAILKSERTNDIYCQPNTKASTCLKGHFRNGKSRKTFAEVADLINKARDEQHLCNIMQDDRWVLWNSENTTKDTGTIEFRGDPLLTEAKDTVHWVAFATAFVQLALKERKLQSGKGFPYAKPGSLQFQKSVEKLWGRLRDCTEEFRPSQASLPSDYEMM